MSGHDSNKNCNNSMSHWLITGINIIKYTSDLNMLLNQILKLKSLCSSSFKSGFGSGFVWGTQSREFFSNLHPAKSFEQTMVNK